MIGERAEGIEPSCVAWKATVLPLNYARMSNRAMLSNQPNKCNSELLRRADAALDAQALDFKKRFLFSHF
jgi:hypothetical protein